MTHKIDVSVIIVNYNTRDLLSECLYSIFSQTKQLDFEVIVVDNNSSDGSKEYITERFPCVKWIDSPSNLGFGKANNLGASHALGHYLFLLNSDTILQNNAIKIFFDYASAHNHERIGALGGWLLNKDGTNGQSYGQFPTISSEVRYIFGKRLPVKPGEQISVDYIIGADIFITKELFNSLNGFDPEYFMYYEETDLQLRISKQKLERRIIPGTKILHLEGGSFKSKGLSYERFIMSQKSFNYYIYKNFSPCKRYSFRLVMMVLRLALFTNPWTLKQKLRAYSLTLNLSKPWKRKY